jgi:hypothetical protein
MAARFTHALARIVAVLAVLGLLLAALGAQPAWADAVVGGGNPADCTETAFDTAFALGGLITFNCGPAPMTIFFTSAKFVLNGDVTIDGGGLITLSGGNSTRLFNVTNGYQLTLKNIVLEKGNSGNSPAGAIFNSLSTLILDHATIQDSHTDNQPGGAIHANGGAITLTNNSLIQNNNGYNYGAINTIGTLVVDHSVIRNNSATFAGGGLSLGGQTTIDHSQIYSNTTSGAGGGGGLYFTAPSRATILNSQIISNSAPDLSSFGGGIENFGVLTLTNTSLSDNRANAGAGLSNENGGQAALDQVAVSGNMASGYNGGLNNEGVLTLTHSSLSGNRAPTNGEAGGLGAGGSAQTTISDSSVTGNFAGSAGGLESAGGPFTLTNVTLSGNSANGQGGGLLAVYGPTTLVNITFSGNSASLGGGIYFSAAGVGDTLTLKNTLLADSGAGGNCAVDGGSANPVASAGFNLSDDHSCESYFNQGGDQNGQPARLLPLANNGGFTLTHLPRRTSPAIDNGTGLGCPATDQRGQPRPAGGTCDIGAVEVQPADLAWALFLPAARR